MGDAESDCSTDFNPRSYKRSDDVMDKIFNRFPISIHAPTRGATVDVDHMLDKLGISIHAPTRGATSLCHISILII